MIKQRIKSLLKNSLRTVVNEILRDEHDIDRWRGQIVVNKEQIEKLTQLVNHKNQQEYLIYLLQTDLIRKSCYWQPEWYLQKYQHHLLKYDALDYWLKTGWKDNENPSIYFNTEYYKKTYHPDYNPLTHFLLKGRFLYHYPSNCNQLVNQINREQIKNYWQKKSKRKPHGVIYVCICGGYDDLRQIEAYHYFDPAWDYVCFSDQSEDIEAGRVGIWQVRPLVFDKLDPVRNNRWHKIHPHLLFPEYDQSIYLDANIDLLTSHLFDLLERNDKKIFIPTHASNANIYHEYDWALESKIDDQNLIKNELKIMKENNMPENYGMTENNLIYRKHHDNGIIKLMNEWWQFIENYSKRDQLSFTYLLYKHNIKVEDITFTNTRVDIDNFYLFDHVGSRKKRVK